MTAPAAQPNVFVVVVSYRVRDHLRECLRSLLLSQDVNLKVCAVDNASGDGSEAMVRNEFPEVELLASPVNGGYAYGNNLALRRFAPFGAEDGPRYVLLCNPDVVVPPHAIAEQVDYLERHPRVGVVGPKLLRPDGSLDLACRRSFPTPDVAAYRLLGLSLLFPQSPKFGRYNLTFRDPDELTEVDAVVGAFMLVRWEAIAAAGLLDEDFFLYGEDLDWMLRMKACGYKVVYNPAVIVRHIKRASTSQIRLRTNYEFYRAMLLFYNKHYRASTPTWLHSLIVGSILARGAAAVAEAAVTGGVRRLAARVTSE
jgi:N-acetylglucosaminyl-diphospho-decaprenol L-rhamnosyltransferase